MTQLTRILALLELPRTIPCLRRGYVASLASGLCLLVVHSPLALADTVTTYQLSGVSFTDGTNTWNITGSFTYDNFDIGGSGTESNALFTITGPSLAYSGTYNQVAPANSSGNGFYALGTRTDGTPPGMPFDVVLDVLANQEGGVQATPITAILFAVPGYGNFVGFYGTVGGTNVPEVTGQVVPSPVPLPATWIGMLSGLAMFGFLGIQKSKIPAARRSPFGCAAT